MPEKYDKLRSNMSFNVTAGIVLLLAVFSIIVSAIGILSFTESFKKEHSTTTYHMADTAAMLVNGDHIDEYLRGEEMEEYARTKRILDTYCRYMNVSLVYVIDVDRSDYNHFVSVFNAVDNAVDDTAYEEWEIGHERETTNEEYRRKYEELYEKKVLYGTIYRLNPGKGLHPHITTIVPVLDSADEVAALLCVQRPINELAAVVRVFVIRTGIFALLLAFFASQLAAYFSRKWIISPIRKISGEATRFAKENTKGAELGDVSRFSEIYNLSRAIDKMETDMENYVQNLTAVTAERERIGTELSFARKIQHDALPHTYPAFPGRTEFDIYASMTPAKEVGGDFYNFDLIDEDHLAMWIGDVSDKGVPAALFMMAINIVIENRVIMGGSPAEIMAYVNNNVCAHSKTDMFVTIWLGILEISTGRIICCNAGHEDPAVYKKGGAFEIVKKKHNTAVGAMPDLPYNDEEIFLEKGDKLFIYTDGVPEATNSFNELFTVGRMVDALNEYCEGTPQEILEGMHKSVNEFVGDRTQFDDLTMLCVELKG